MRTHKRPELREAIRALLAVLVPAIRDGGAVPLTDLVGAVAGAKLTAEVRARLDQRGLARFSPDPQSADTSFFNEGPETRIRLKSFDIKIPKVISGRALLEGAGSANLRFDRSATPIASKLLASVRLQSLSLDDTRVLAAMETSVFDQCFELV
jgi:hypothetical protein